MFPPTPQAPPSDDDVVRAYQYAESATIAKRKGLIDDPSFVEALRYQNDVLLAKSAHPIPPWFTQAMKASLEDIKQHVSVMLSKAVDEIKKAGSVTIQDAVDELKKAGDITMQQAVDKMTKAADGIARLAVDEIKKTADGTTQHTVDELKKAVKEMNCGLDAKVNQLARVTAQTVLLFPLQSLLFPMAPYRRPILTHPRS
ncbi:hypothetical protein B0H14DRAFT_226504 [Mycena olivaceomarginata]|nr:hypothetical protein B0H14DRAFT_226504 [Mycena olivaceomarginata]